MNFSEKMDEMIIVIKIKQYAMPAFCLKKKWNESTIFKSY